MPEFYTDHGESVIDSYRRVHGNGEETHILIVSCNERYVALAYDVDPRDFEPVASHLISYSPTQQAAEERVRVWMENNPKGVAYDQEDDSEGIGAKIWNALKKLDQSAEPTQDSNNDG
jgi:light-regulated signal transduction histidine kinase (bacteriophytochrome)